MGLETSERNRRQREPPVYHFGQDATNRWKPANRSRPRFRSNRMIATGLHVGRKPVLQVLELQNRDRIPTPSKPRVCTEPLRIVSVHQVELALVEVKSSGERISGPLTCHGM